MKVKLLVDSDGIAANFQRYVEENYLSSGNISVINQMPAKERETWMRKMYEDDPHLFYMLEPIEAFNKLLGFIKSKNIPFKILTAAGTEHPDYELVKQDKLDWFLEHFNIPSDQIVVVKKSSDKSKFATKDSILIDDFKKNCDEFEKAGGRSILVESNYYNADDVIDKLIGMI